jgi:hypothetical protein
VLAHLPAADDGSDAVALTGVELAPDAVQLLLGDERPHLRLGVEAATELDLPCMVSDAGEHVVVDLALDVQPRAGQQHWPWLKKIAFAAPGIAVSRSASAKTTFGALPPSSSVTRLRSFAAALTISFPSSVEPLNATLSTPGCAASAAPAVSPKPVITLTTPFRSPASCTSSASRAADSGVRSATFSTTVHPVASAGPSFHAAISSGKLHGMICPTTPTASLTV